MLNPTITQSWAEAEVADAKLPDLRLKRRYALILATLAAQPVSSVTQACDGDWAAIKAIYRFWDHDKITPAALRAPHFAATATRAAAYSTVLAIQDTTSLDFTHHPHTEGLGYLEQKSLMGLKVHSVFVASAAGLPLGVADQQVWKRDLADLGSAAERRKRTINEKESGRWLAGLQAAQNCLPNSVRIIHIADREADIFEFFSAPRAANSEVLIRAEQNRVVNHELRYLFAAVRAAAVQGEQEIEVAKRKAHAARTARVSIRFSTVTIQPPRNHGQREQLQPVSLQAVLVEEEAPPTGEKPVRWLLLTSLAVSSLPQAQQCVTWYSYRWLIERYHLVLKSGCRIEALQLETAARLERALATYSIVAWRLLWLTYEARQTPERSCEQILSRSEWQVLWAHSHGPANIPAVAPPLGEAVRLIAKLGGFIGRKRDGQPGVQTLWRGMMRLQDMAATWRMFHPEDD